MRFVRLAVAIAVATLATGLSACSTSTTVGPHGGNATDATPNDADITSCLTDPLAEKYAPNMVQTGTGGHLQFQLVSSSAADNQGVQVQGAPQQGTNTWVLKVLDASGKPVTDATFPPPPMTVLGCPPTPAGWPVGVLPCMPHHGHGSSQPTVTNNHDGTYTISDLYLYMVGLWQVHIWAQSGMVTDSTAFGFCVGE
jgi:hypothetical protein